MMNGVHKEIRPPKGERTWVCYCNDERPMFLLTSKEGSRDFYFLYEIIDGKLNRLGKSRSPIELEKKYDIEKKLGIKR